MQDLISNPQPTQDESSGQGVLSNLVNVPADNTGGQSMPPMAIQQAPSQELQTGAGLGSLAAQQQMNNATQPQSIIKQYTDALASAGQNGVDPKYFNNVQNVLDRVRLHRDFKGVPGVDPYWNDPGTSTVTKVNQGMTAGSSGGNGGYGRVTDRFHSGTETEITDDKTKDIFANEMKYAVMQDTLSATEKEGIAGALKILTAMDPKAAMEIKKQAADVDQSVAMTAKLNSETENEAIKNKNDSQIFLGNIYSMIAGQPPERQQEIYSHALEQIRQIDPNAPDQYNPARGSVSIAEAVPALRKYQEDSQNQRLAMQQNTPTELEKNYSFIQSLAPDEQKKALGMLNRGNNTIINTGDQGQQYKVEPGYMIKDPSNPAAGVTPIPGGSKDQQKLNDAARLAALNDASRGLGLMNRLVYNPDGSINRKNLITSTEVNLPGYGKVSGVPGTSGSQLSQLADKTAEAVARSMAQRAPTADQLAMVKQNFIPNKNDSEEVVNQKMSQLSNFIAQTQRMNDPSGRFQHPRFADDSMNPTESMPQIPGGNFQAAGTATPDQMNQMGQMINPNISQNVSPGAAQSGGITPYMQQVNQAAQQAIQQGRDPRAVAAMVQQAAMAEQQQIQSQGYHG